jgi:hypothetical protein
MKIGKPLLLFITPLGVVGGLYEAHRLVGGLAWLMGAMILLLGAAFAQLIYVMRREREQAARDGDQSVKPGPPAT